MKAVVIRNPGQGIEAWKLVEVPKPEAQPGEVVVRMRAASINYRDLLTARGQYGGPLAKDLVPLVDGAGQVAAVGEGVTRWKKGDRVATAYYPTWQSGPMRAEYLPLSGGTHETSGTLAEYIIRSADSVVRIPDYLSYEQASTLTCTAVTAWHALFEPTTRLRPGATVVVQGTGGVSIVAAQLALSAGFRVIATSSSDAKIDRLRSLGVHDVINYRTTPDWEKAVIRATNGEGADQIIEVGGPATLPRSFEAVKTGGIVTLVGILTGVDVLVNPMPVLFKSIRLEGLTVGSVAMFESLNRTLEAVRLVPIVDEVFSLDQATAALKKVEGSTHFGKVVIRID